MYRAGRYRRQYPAVARGTHAMGLEAALRRRRRARIDNPVHTNADVDSLSTANTDALGYVGEAIQSMMYSNEILWRRLMGKIVEVQAPFAS